MRLKNRLSKIGISLFSLIFFSCLTIKPGAVKAGKNLYVSYGVGKYMVYYIKPLGFSSTQNSLDVDITFKHFKIEEDTASLKFSIYESEVVKALDSAQIVSAGKVLYSTTCKHMFSEHKKNRYVNRFELLMPLPYLYEGFKNGNWQIVTYKNGKSIIYTPQAKSLKYIERLNKSVFAVL